MAKTKVKLDNNGMRLLLESPEIQAELVSRMASVQAALPGSELLVVRRGRRVQVRVVRGSDYEEANTGEMSRALDNAGGIRGDKWKSKTKRIHS